MIADVNAILTKVGDPGYKRVEGWRRAAARRSQYPVPPAWFNPTMESFLPFSRLRRLKSDVFYYKRFVYWQKVFTIRIFFVASAWENWAC